jgi:NAD(P) transhydrogenase subunit alpha
MSPEFIAAEMALFAEQAGEVDIIITTALIPGKPAPKLITADMVRAMRDGSVIVDLAAEQGGNCELTVPGERVVREGVSIVGFTDLPSRMAAQSSELYATNIRHLIDDLTPENDGHWVLDMDDDVIRGTTVVQQGERTWPPPPLKVPAIAAAKASAKAEAADPDAAKRSAESAARRSGWTQLGLLIVGGALLLLVGSFAPASFMQHFIVFVLACFVGFQVIWNVTPALHTPLMAVTNAISGIIVVGAILQIGAESTVVTVLAAVSILIATINICGGFLVTKRMLAMFERS